jgi:hypothetical protein
VAARLNVSVFDPLPQTTGLPNLVPDEAVEKAGVLTLVEHQSAANPGFMLPLDPATPVGAAARLTARPIHFLLSDPQYGLTLDRFELHLGKAFTPAGVMGQCHDETGDLIESDPGGPRVEWEAGAADQFNSHITVLRGTPRAATWSRTQEGETP